MLLLESLHLVSPSRYMSNATPYLDFLSNLYPGTYALIGAAAFLGGTCGPYDHQPDSHPDRINQWDWLWSTYHVDTLGQSCDLCTSWLYFLGVSLVHSKWLSLRWLLLEWKKRVLWSIPALRSENLVDVSTECFSLEAFSWNIKKSFLPFLFLHF